MIWIICASMALLMLLIGTKAYASEKNGAFRGVFTLACLYVATYLLYLPPFMETYGILSGMIANLVQVLRAITTDADITQYYDVINAGIGNSVGAQCYISLLGILHICLPTLSALTAVTVLFRCFSTLQVFFADRRKRPLYVFSEVNERSVHLAKSLRNQKCDIIFAGRNDDVQSGEFQGKHAPIFKEESISELSIRGRKGKEIYFFCISRDEDLGLSHCLQLIEKYASLSEEEQEHIHIFQFSKHRDYAVFVDSANKYALDVQCINEYEMQIYNLLDQHPLFRSSQTGIHVLLYGLSDLNVVALRAIAWCGQLGGLPLRISVVGTDMAHKLEDLRMNIPGLFTHRYNIQFFDCKTQRETVEVIGRECADAGYVIVSEETDNLTMERGIMLRRLFYKLDPAFAACPQIFCNVKEPAKSKLIKQLATAESNPKRKMSYDLIPFGGLEEIYTYENLVDSNLERLAKNVHLAYEEIFSDGEIDVKEALRRYQIFEVNKRSNRANALHIRYKLRMLGLDYTDAPDAQAVQIRDYYTDESLEKIAISEHDRWMAFLEMEGWTPAMREDVLAYRESGISKGRHNCPVLKMHPYICEYEKLETLSVELEGKDTTVYDKELIVRIPDILGDKWNVSGKKYKIVKL